MNNPLREGVKYDKHKLRYDLIPLEALEEVAEVLTFGARKYGDRNWEKGMDWSRVYGACLRHLFDWANPFKPNKDLETGLSHLSHALCCMMFLITYEKRQVGKNNLHEK